MRQFVRSMPTLPRKLRSARIADTPEYYVKKTLTTTVFLVLGLTLIVFSFTKSWLSLYTVLLSPLVFMYFLHYADMRILQLDREISQEIIYAGRFLIIELESGVPLFNTFQNVSRSYQHVGSYFREVVDRVNLGTSIEDAINEMLDYLPSNDLRKLFWQILNSLRTGSEITSSLQVAVDHIVREQKIQVVEYGRKLSPLAMFYMMMAVILPSLGTTLIIVMATFIGFKLTLPVLLTTAGLLMFIQFMFLAAIKTQRPAVAF